MSPELADGTAVGTAYTVPDCTALAEGSLAVSFARPRHLRRLEGGIALQRVTDASADLALALRPSPWVI